MAYEEGAEVGRIDQRWARGGGIHCVWDVWGESGRVTCRCFNQREEDVAAIGVQ
jgi:hypothetical protein